MDSQNHASPFHQRFAFRVFRPVILQEDSSFVSAMLQPPQVSLTFSHSFPRAGHGNRHCPYVLHSSFSQQDSSCCSSPILSLCLHFFFHSLLQKWFSPPPLALRHVLQSWRQLHSVPQDSPSALHAHFPDIRLLHNLACPSVPSYSLVSTR